MHWILNSHMYIHNSRLPRFLPETLQTHIQNICISFAFLRIFEIRVTDQDGVHVGAGILVQLAVASNHDDCYFNIT